MKTTWARYGFPRPWCGTLCPLFELPENLLAEIPSSVRPFAGSHPPICKGPSYLHPADVQRFRDAKLGLLPKEERSGILPQSGGSWAACSVTQATSQPEALQRTDGSCQKVRSRS